MNRVLFLSEADGDPPRVAERLGLVTALAG